MEEYTTPVHIQYVHTHELKVEIRTRKTMLQVTNIRTTINTQVYFMPWARCRPLSCLPRTDLTTVAAWLPLIGFCLFFFSGSSKRREVMFFTAEHANRTSSSSDSLGGRTGRAGREGEMTWRGEGGRKGSTLGPQSSDQNIMHLVVYGVTSPWSGIGILLEHSLDNTLPFTGHIQRVPYIWVVKSSCPYVRNENNDD